MRKSSSVIPQNVPETPKDQRIMFVGLLGKGREQWVKLAPRQFDGGEIAAGILEVPANRLIYDDLSGDLKGCAVGAIYAVGFRDSHVIFEKKALPVAHLTNESLRAEWQARHQAIKRNLDAEARLLSEGKHNSVHQHLKAIRSAYQNLNGPQRAQLIADVVAFIARPG